MRLRYLGDPGRHYPELGLLAYPDDVRELAEDPGDSRWVEVDPDTPLTDRPAGQPVAEPVDEHQADEHQAVAEPAAAAAAAAAAAGEQSSSEQANTRGARRSGKETV